MKESQKLGLLASVINMLNDAGSWTGRTHVQKFMYFAQKLLGLPSGYEFVLYQRGPYSFDLDADIRSLRSIGGVDLIPAPPYGPTYVPTDLGKALIRLSPVGEQMNKKLIGLAAALGKPKQARDLELLATTLYVLEEEGVESTEGIADRVVLLKPQFRRDEAVGALVEVKEILERFR